MPCPCGSGRGLQDCCEPRLAGTAPALTAEQLMRSRYTAYVLKDEPYLLRTWHPSTRPARLALDEGGAVKWLGLKVLRTERGGEQDENGIVEFVARFKPTGAAGRLHEASRFVREHGEWFYVSGEIRA